MKKTAVFSLVLIALFSCTKAKLEESYASQESKIDTFVTKLVANDSTITVTTNNGANRVTLVEGTGDALKDGGTVSFYYAGYIFNGSLSSGNIFATNYEEFAQGQKWTITDGDYDILTMTLSSDKLLPGLKNGFIGAKGGEECYIIFSGKYGFGSSAFGTIPANSALLYHIWVQSISNE